MTNVDPLSETHVTSRIALDPADWCVATWRPRTPLPRPTPPAFDRAEALARLRRLLPAHTAFAPVDWSRAGLAETLSPAEAHFWFVAMTDAPRDARSSSTALARLPLTGHISREELRARLRQRGDFLTPLVVVALSGLLAPAELLDVLLDDQLCVIDPYHTPHYQIANLQEALLDGFRRHVRPYLDDPTLEQLRQLARTRLPSSLWTQSAAPAMEQLLAYRLAPLLGMHRELSALASSWPDDLFPRRGGYEEWRRRPQEMLFGLGDPWLVEQHTRRLNLVLRSDADARAWLAHTETQALDVVVDSVRAGTSFLATKLLDVLCLVQAPAAARPLLELRLEGRSSPSLKRWLEQRPANAVAGLLPFAAGRGKVGNAVRQYLRELKRRGLAGLIEGQLSLVEPVIATRVQNTILDVADVEYPLLDETSTPVWLQQALLSVPALPADEFPDWLSLDDLPPIVIGARRLDPAQLAILLRTLAAAKIDSPPPLLTALRTHVDAASREAFVWRLIEQWQCAGAPERDIRALNAAGFLGGDESALKLAALIRDAKGPGGRRRALQALDALAAVGSSLALLQLTALARQARSRPIRDRARELVAKVAVTRGLSRAELDDCSVPNPGFEGDLGPAFDFGPRQFQAVLAVGQRLLLRDESGGVRDDLPAPGASDDHGRASQATADWRLLRKTVREVFKEQSVRLERAMTSGQRWSPRHFRERISAQPLLNQLARLLLWGGYDERGRLARTFRLTEEKAFVDAQERALSLFDFNSVRVVHPLELSEEARHAWSTIWRDHELIAPFPQLGRRLFPLRDADRLQTVITAFRGRRVPALTLGGLVKARDWAPTFLGRSRLGEAHVKEYRVWATTAVLHHPNVGPVAYPNRQARQELRGAYFFRGPLDPDEPIDLDRALRLWEVHDLVRQDVSELMAAIFAKGKE